MPPDDPGSRPGAAAAVQNRPAPSPEALKLLILEDEPADAELMTRELRKAGLDFTAMRVDRWDDFVAALETPMPDVLLADFKLQGFSGAEALTYVRQVHPEIPVVMVSGKLGDEAAIELVKAGARDYVLKSNLLRLPSAVERAIAVEQGIRARKAAERAVRDSEAKFRAFTAAAPNAIIVIDATSTISYWNPKAEQMLGYTAAEAVGRQIHQWLVPERFRAVAEAGFRAFAKTGQGPVIGKTVELAALHKNGTEIPVELSLSALQVDAEWHAVGILHDISERKQAEEKTREDAAKFRSLVEQNVAGIFIIREDGTIGYVNPFFAATLGYAAADLIGHPLLDIIPENEIAAARAKLEAQLAGQVEFVEHRLTMSSRESRPIDLLVNASRSIFEGRPALLAMVLDVTQSNKAQRELASTAATLATEHELSPDGILVVDEMAQIVSTNRRFAEIFAVPAQVLADKADEPLLQWAVDQVADGAAFLSRVRYLYDHPQETSAEEIVLKDGRVLDRYSAPMNRAGGEYAGRVWFFRDVTERRRAEETLRGSEERFRLLVEEAPDAILLYDVDQRRLVAANKAAERLFGLARDQIVKHGPQHFYMAEQPDAQPVPQTFDAHSNRALAGEETTFERRIRTALGQERLCRVTLVQMPAPGQRLLRASFIDITDQKAAERALLRLNRTLRTLSRGNEVLVHAASEAVLLSEMCHVIVDTGGYRMAWVGAAEHDAARSVTPVAWAGVTGDYLKQARITWAEGPRGSGLVGRAIRRGEPINCQNIAADPGMAPWREAAKTHGFASSIALPLKDQSGVFAALTLYSDEVDAFDPDELNLLRELAEDLAFGIRSLREHTAHEALNRRWRASLEATVGAIANTVEMRDPYTAGHQQRVARLAVAIARELAMPERQIEGLYLAGIVHDVGKIDIPSDILNKPGKLSPLQFQLIQGHAQAGFDIVKGVDFPWPIAQMILQHHERLDGSGYPQGLSGEAILPEAKIIAVADVVEAMMSHRPYRPALGIEAALAEIERGSGSRYDPAAVAACLALFRAKGFTFAPPAEAD